MSAWPEAEEFLRPAVTDDKPEGYLRHVQSLVFSGIHTLWKMFDDDGETVAYGVVHIYTNDGIVKVAQMYLTTTTGLKHLLDNMDLFISWGIKHKVNYLEVIGRKGWEKVLRPYGFTHNQTSLIRRIPQELH